MRHSKYPSLLLFLLAGIVLTGCSQKDKSERVISFDRNLVNTQKAELVCQISEESAFLGNITNFTILNDTSFVVLDDKGAYLYHTSGTFKKRFGTSGRASGEMIRPSYVYATSNLVYIWCSTLMKFLIFDHEANFKKELAGFKRAVSKFVVDSSDQILYIYTSGFLNETETKKLDVIDVYNIAENSSKKYGERGPEDEVLYAFAKAAGLCIDKNRLIYLHPGNLIIYNLDLGSDKTIRYRIDDKAFHTTEITVPIRSIMEDYLKLRDYLYKNSIVTDLYSNNDQFVIISEIGEYALPEPGGQSLVTQNRKVKLYILNRSFKPDRTILYDFISHTNLVVYSNSLYFIDRTIEGDDLTLNLMRFPLSESKQTKSSDISAAAL
jgi:hypothetical protein